MSDLVNSYLTFLDQWLFKTSEKLLRNIKNEVIKAVFKFRKLHTESTIFFPPHKRQLK
jgi:hypothetical protein